MPTINLKNDPDDVGWVMAIMAFPVDAKLREQFFAIHKANQSMRSADSSHAVLTNAFSIEPLLAAPSYTQMNKLWREATKCGMRAGDLLASVYVMSRFNIAEPSINKAIFVSQAWARKETYGDGSKMHRSAPKIREYWRTYKSVAHLWAAFRLNQDYPVKPQGDLFAKEGFPVLLSLAAELWRFGTTFVPKRSKDAVPILEEESSWRLPDRIKPLVPELGTRPDQLLDLLRSYKAPINK